MTPWEKRRAAKIPNVLPAVAEYLVPTVAVIEIRFASPKVIPVVTATWPSRLNLYLVRIWTKVGVAMNLRTSL